MGNLTLRTFGLLLASITLGSFGQICMKAGLRTHPLVVATSPGQMISNLAVTLTQPWVVAGLALYVISVFTWMLLISRVRLSVVYPMISLSYVLVMVLSVLMLHESVRWHYAIGGLAFIGAGVSFIGLGLGRGR